MKTPSFLLSLAGLGLVLGACSAEKPAELSTTGDGDPVEIPTQEDLDAQAAEDITEENADQALSDLEAEINGDA